MVHLHELPGWRAPSIQQLDCPTTGLTLVPRNSHCKDFLARRRAKVRIVVAPRETNERPLASGLGGRAAFRVKLAQIDIENSAWGLASPAPGSLIVRHDDHRLAAELVAAAST
jgi:hypothetical protein